MCGTDCVTQATCRKQEVDVSDAAASTDRLATKDRHLRAVVNAILYLASTVVSGGQLPKIFRRGRPSGRSFMSGRAAGFVAINHMLVMAAREKVGREASLTAGVIDSQLVKTTKAAVHAGLTRQENCKGRKRHIVTDTEGHLVGLQVHQAGYSGS